MLNPQISLEVFAICYNEEILLPFFIEHYKKMGAKITIYDNNSTDSSRKIILDAGCKLFAYDTNNQIRDDIYLKIKNNCWKNSDAEWVIVCDIDEFLEVNFDVSNYTIINTKGYDIVGMPPSRFGVENPLYSKHIMFRRSHFKEIGYNFGCHQCKPVGNISGSKEIATLLHYKYISEDYMYKRKLMYQSRLSELNIKYGWGIEYQKVDMDEINKAFIDLRAKGGMVL